MGWGVLLTLAIGCGSGGSGVGGSGGSGVGGSGGSGVGGSGGSGGSGGGGICAGFAGLDYPAAVPACDLGPTDPSGFFITTINDAFDAGGIATASVAGVSATADVAVATTDSVPFHHNGLLYVLNRYGFDSLTVRDPGAAFAVVNDYGIDITGAASTNPQSLAFASDGRAFVTLFDQPQVQILDTTQPPASALLGNVDISAFADSDGNPEAGRSFACGDLIFVEMQRLANFANVDCTLLVAIDATTLQPYASAIPLLGSYIKQVRRDPSVAAGNTVLLLTTGIEAIDLATGTASWVVPDTLFAGSGFGSWNLLSFDVSNDGATFYVAISRTDYSGVDVYAIARTGTQSLDVVVADLNASGATLELIDDTTLWFGDRTTGGAGLRTYDVSVTPAVETTPVDGNGNAVPLNTGLAPYNMVGFP